MVKSRWCKSAAIGADAFALAACARQSDVITLQSQRSQAAHNSCPFLSQFHHRDATMCDLAATSPGKTTGLQRGKCSAGSRAGILRH